MLSAPIHAGLGVAQAAAPPVRAAGEVAIDYQPDAGLIGLRARSATLEDVLTEIENTTGVEVVRHLKLPQFVDVDLAPMPLKPFFEALLNGYNLSIMGGEGAQQVTKVWVMSASRRPLSPARVAGEAAGSLESPRGSWQAATEHSAGPAGGEDTSEGLGIRRHSIGSDGHL